MKKINSLLGALLIIVLLSSANTFAQTPILVEYYGTDSCMSCVEVKNSLEHLEKSGSITLIENNISNPDVMKKLIDVSTEYGVPEGKQLVVPIIFTKDQYIIGKEDIHSWIDSPNSIIVENETNPLSSSKIKYVVSLALAGLLDGINPCSISMLLFFFSFVLSSKEVDVYRVGSAFILGTFVTYLIIGFGILNLLNLAFNYVLLSLFLYGTLAGVGIFIAWMNINDYIALKEKKYSDLKNQLSSGVKKNIHAFIKKQSGKRALFLASFITASIVSVMEFFCTGQIYLPSIAYMLSSGQSMIYNIFLLILYNTMFVLPLVLCVVFVGKAKDSNVVAHFLFRHLSKIKLLGFFFFLLVSIFFIKRIFELVSIL